MQNYAKMSLDQLANLSVPCACGEVHEITTKHIVMQEGAISALEEIVKEIMPSGKVLVVTAEDVYEKAALSPIKALEQSGYTVLTHVFAAHFQPAITCCGELFSYPEDVRLVIAVGSGAVTDTVRYFASVRETEFISLPTAPSMDGYLSCISVLYVNGVKESFEAKPPYAVVADLNVIAASPRKMIAAGFGDVMAKYLALYDWYFAYAVNGEKYCNDIADYVLFLTERCLALSDGLVRGERAAIAALTEALLCSSAAMQLLGNSRCASGGEHHVAHCLEMMSRAAGKEPKLHGEWVFYAARKLVHVYELFLDNRLNDTAVPPDKGLRAEKLAEYCGVNEHEALGRQICALTKEEYDLRQYRLEEYRDDLAAMLHECKQKILRANKVFKRIYEDLGYGVGRSVKAQDFKIALSLAPDVRTKFTTLTMMRDMGLLDVYLR